MTLQDISSIRLRNQQIEPRLGKDPLDIVSHLGAVQAQDYPGSLWAIGLRCSGITKSDIEKSISRREIVRTWPMRGTLHFVAGKDIKWMLELLTPRVIANSSYRIKNLELSEEIFEKSRKIFLKSLRGGNKLKRDEMMKFLEDAGITTDGQRGIHILWHLSQEGLLCFGPHLEKQPTFVLLNEWVTDTKSLSREESLAEITKRYFIGHGPATIQDFMWWTGLVSTDAKSGLEMVKKDLNSEKINEKVYWMGKSESKSSPTPSYNLLPGFDEYLLGYKDRSAVLQNSHSSKIVPGNNGMFLPTIVIDGKVAGLWKRKIGKKEIKIDLQLFDRKIKPTTKLLKRAVKKYSDFMEVPISLL